MRVLAVHPGPHFSVADVHNGVIKGLRANGCEVVDFNLDRRLDFYVNAMLEIDGVTKKAFEYEAACTLATKGLEAACYEFWPDVVIIMSGFFTPPDLFRLMRARAHHVVLWCTESPYEDDRQLAMAHAADTVILNDPINIDEFRERNPRTFYLPHSYDPEVHYPARGCREVLADFSFVGTGYPSRVAFFEQVDWSGIDALFAGNWQSVDDGSPLVPLLAHERGQCIDNVDAAGLYRGSLTSANLYRREASFDDLAEGWAMGPREVELAACGTWFARDPRPESDGLLPMLPSFTEPGEFGELLRWALAHDEEREKAAAAAAAAVADRTFEATTGRLLKLIAG